MHRMCCASTCPWLVDTASRSGLPETREKSFLGSWPRPNKKAASGMQVQKTNTHPSLQKLLKVLTVLGHLLIQSHSHGRGGRKELPDPAQLGPWNSNQDQAKGGSGSLPADDEGWYVVCLTYLLSGHRGPGRTLSYLPSFILLTWSCQPPISHNVHGVGAEPGCLINVRVSLHPLEGSKASGHWAPETGIVDNTGCVKIYDMD